MICALWGGCCFTENARCLTTRYDAGIRKKFTGSSGVAIPVLTPDRANKRQNGRRFKEDGDPSFTLTTQDVHGVAVSIEDEQILRAVRSDYAKEIRKEYDTGNVDEKWSNLKEYEPRNDGISNTVSTVTKDNLLSLKIKEATRGGYCEATERDAINLAMPNSKTRRGRVGKGMANTLDTSCNQGILVQVSDELVVYAVWSEKHQCYIAIRKLTPKECFRLQGWTDDYFEKAQFVNTDSQLYKQAGNGVTVNVVYEIGKAIKRIEENQKNYETQKENQV